MVLESDRARLQSLVTRFSREDLLRSFDLIAQAETDVKEASQPSYTLEMALLKSIHLRKLVPLANLIGQLEKGGLACAPQAGGPRPHWPRRPSRSRPFGARPAFAPRPTAPTPRPAPHFPRLVQRRPRLGATALRSFADGPLPADFKDRFLEPAPAAEPHVL